MPKGLYISLVRAPGILRSTLEEIVGETHDANRIMAPQRQGGQFSGVAGPRTGEAIPGKRPASRLRNTGAWSGVLTPRRRRDTMPNTPRRKQKGTAMFEQELKFFIANQQQLVAQHAGKTLVIRGEAVDGVYGSPLEAYVAAQKKYAPGTFMIQPCEPGPSAYTVTLST